MGRIESCFESLRSKGEKGLITFITAGDPSIENTLDYMQSLVDGGADVIELGVPFSDPMADGPTIQRASERSLAAGTDLSSIFMLVRAFRERNASTPVILMGYMNPFESMGVQEFCKEASNKGVDGILIVDMPPEESTEFSKEAKNYGIDVIRLIAPTTDLSRAKEICNLSSGYIYYISVKGITGSKDLDSEDVQQKVELLSTETNLPIAIGFGIKDSKSALSVKDFADGIVVGSVFVDLVGEGGDTIKKIAAKTKELSLALK
mgnify:CR=1 FL=1